MPKPIPVFVFAFAAYAATSARRSDRSRASALVSGDSARIFVEFYHMLSRNSSARVIVKIAPGEPLSPGAFFPAEGTAFWLGDLVETVEGFRGTVVSAPTRRRRIKHGQNIDFVAEQVLGWSVKTDDNELAPLLRDRPTPIAVVPFTKPDKV